MVKSLVAPALMVTAIAATAWFWNQAQAQPRDDSPRRPESVAVFMKPKLDHAQRVLEGLALEQFDVIGREAHALSLLSREAEWQVLQTEDYLHFSGEFRRAAEAMRTAASQKNLDAATLAYVTMTVQCVECHKYVRNVRTTDARPLREGIR